MHPSLRQALDQRQEAVPLEASMRDNVLRNGLVEVAAIGAWTMEAVDEHFEGLERRLAETRGAFGLARVLVNLRRSPPQSAEIASRLSYWTNRIYRPEDRVAILVDSDAMREQQKRFVLISTFQVFVSEVAARLWLYED